MPLFHFKCPLCEMKSRVLLPAEKVDITRFCSNCDSPIERDLQGPTAQVKEVVDTGLMVRRLEITKK